MNSTTTALLAATIIVLALYLVRRRSRLNKED